MNLKTLWQRHRKLILFSLTLLFFIISYSRADRGFQVDSETLVTGAVMAERKDIAVNDYGMGIYSDILGDLRNYNIAPLNGILVENGYLTDRCGLLVAKSSYSDMIAKKTAAVMLANGERIAITKIAPVAKEYTAIYLAGDSPLNEKTAGKITDLKFIDDEGNILPSATFTPYRSQYGLPGKMAIMADKVLGSLNIYGFRGSLNIICGLASALVFMAISYLVAKKYDNLLGLAFLFTFITGEWVRNFAINSYWVEFTWFIPMLLGLYCSLNRESFKRRYACYGLAFFAILVKSLSGYEYLSTIMLGMIMFPLTDMLIAVKNHNKKIIKQAGCIIIGLGFMGILGFFTALSMHAELRGNGDINTGIANIYHQDVLRRTWAGDEKSNFGENYQPSLNAGALEVVGKYYLHWSGSLVRFIPAKTFPLLALLPLLIWYCYRRKNKPSPISTEIWLLYGLSFLAAISWFVLAKSHSYVHTHMNYVLWYFGFVQILVYTLLLLLRKLLVQHKAKIISCTDNILKELIR